MKHILSLLLVTAFVSISCNSNKDKITVKDENGNKAKIDLNGDKAIEKYSKSSNRYELTYFTNDRFLVNLEGENVGIDFLKQAAKNLNLK